MKATVEKIDAESESLFRAVRRQEQQFGFHWHYYPPVSRQMDCRRRSLSQCYDQ